MPKSNKTSDENKKLRVLGIIPARIGSTRVPKKMLADIAGKTLIERTYERTKKAKLLDDVIIATDSKDIVKVAHSFGAEAILTSSSIPNGTDRAAVAVKKYKKFDPDIVVNIWGDEPLFPASAIDKCTSLLIDDSSLQVASVADYIKDEELIVSTSIVKVLTDLENNVLFFSRMPVPLSYNTGVAAHYHQIVGVMALRKDFLFTYSKLPRTPVEKTESIEQMRILEHGYRMKVIKGHFNNIGVNTPEELEVVRKIYRRKRK